jgi:hypothetical protein
MNWAWRQQLTPTAKLVLMSLANAADDHGVYWPSVPTVTRLAHCFCTVRSALVTTERSGVVTRAAMSETTRVCGWISGLQRDDVFLYLLSSDRFYPWPLRVLVAMPAT